MKHEDDSKHKCDIGKKCACNSNNDHNMFGGESKHNIITFDEIRRRKITGYTKKNPNDTATKINVMDLYKKFNENLK